MAEIGYGAGEFGDDHIRPAPQPHERSDEQPLAYPGKAYQRQVHDTYDDKIGNRARAL